MAQTRTMDEVLGREKKTEKGLTELVFILDRSGSMHGLERDTIGGFNSLIEQQKEQEGDCLVSVVLFDDVSEVLLDRVPLEKVPVLTDKDYRTRGCTALIDTLGGSVEHIRTIHKYARKEDRPERTMFAVITDGLENASRRYTSDYVKRLIAQQEEKGWEFLFIGANIDAVETASRYGIRPDRAVNYHADVEGTAHVYGNLSRTMASFRDCAPVAADWAEEIAEDYEKRKK